MSNPVIKKIALISLLFLAMAMIGVPTVLAGPLQKVRMKVEGLHEGPHTHFFKKLLSVPLSFVPVTEFSETPPYEKIESALLSVPGVKSVDLQVLKKWLFFKDWKKTYLIVEIEQGSVTSETLILAVESASDQKHLYKAKFVE
ncbi:MAG: hypothetical protein AAB035_04125 [Nitrospirota bacterium]